MIKKSLLALLAIALTTSCVSKKIFSDLENKYTDLKKERNALADENETLKNAKKEAELLKIDLEKIKAERDKLTTDYAASNNNLKALKSAYDALEKNSGEALQSNLGKNRELLAQLEAKEKEIGRAHV